MGDFRIPRLLSKLACIPAFQCTSTLPRRGIKLSTTRNISSNYDKPASVCVVGSGPAGFYTAQQLLKLNPSIKVDIFEKLPVPYGLVRFGVAPDHPEVKNCTNAFRIVAYNDRCRFLGNVSVGEDIKAKELQHFYDACIMAYGADNDRRLGIPGEDLDGVLSARAFVGWYNGLPAHASLKPDLSCETACVIGQGNVALDVARILLAPTEMLKYTDICDHSLRALEVSNVRRVFVIGRRGPLQASFTIKELREMINLEGCRPNFDASVFDGVKELIPGLPRQKKRLVELMYNTAKKEPTPEQKENWSSAEKEWSALFCRSPCAILGNEDGKVKGIKLEVNRLLKADDGSEKAVGIGEYEEIPCGMVLRSIGYKSLKVDEGIPFDQRMGVIPNIAGRAVREARSEEIFPGLYCSGWVKHGPVGVILTTMNEAKQTANALLQDLQDGLIQVKGNNSNHEVEQLLKERGVKTVSFQEWEKIDDEEMRLGKEHKKPREKITSEERMMEIVERV